MSGRSAPAAEFLFGMHAVRHAVAAAPARVKELLLQADREPNAALREILAVVERHGIPVRRVTRQALDSETGYGKHQGVALYRMPDHAAVRELEDLLPRLGADALVLVLDGVQDPHNLGACVRTADAAGAHAVIIPADRAASMTEVALKAAAGAAEHIPILEVKNLARALEQIKKAGLWVYGTAAEADASIHATDFRRPVALVLGGEGKGMRHNVAEHCDAIVKIPLAGHVESLNVSVAAGVCLFEVRRQRQENQDRGQTGNTGFPV